MDGVGKAALLLQVLGQESAEAVLALIPGDIAGKIRGRLSELPQTPDPESAVRVLNEFLSLAEQRIVAGSQNPFGFVGAGGASEKGGQTQEEQIQAAAETGGIEALNLLDPKMVSETIEFEHPQVIAAILVHLERAHASKVLIGLPLRLQKDVVLRVASMDKVSPAALTELNEVITRLLSGNEGNILGQSKGGIRAAAEILNFLGSQDENRLIEGMKTEDSEITQKIVDEMFIFEDLMGVDDRGIQLLLREVNSEALIFALKGASEGIKDKIFKNMSQRAAETLKEELELKGPVRLAEVDGKQKEILAVARRLSDEGKLALAKGESEYV